MTKTARDKLFEFMAGGWSLTQAETAPLYEAIDAALATHAHELAERIRTTAADDDGPATKWNWWDAAEIPGNCADLIDPEVQR